MAVKYISKGKPYQQIKEENLCKACSGSGYYDDNGSPKCSECNGTGLESSR